VLVALFPPLFCYVLFLSIINQNVILFLFVNFLASDTSDNSHVNISQVGVCEVNITQNKIEIGFVDTQSRKVLDKFSIFKSK